MKAKYILWMTVATLATLWLTLDPAAGFNNDKKDAHTWKNEISERREAIDDGILFFHTPYHQGDSRPEPPLPSTSST